MSATYSKWQIVTLWRTPGKTEMLQIKYGQSCETKTNNCTQVIYEWNFRKNRNVMIPSVNTVFYGSQSTSY